MIESNEKVLDLYRAGMQAMLEATKGSLEAAERVRQRQAAVVSAALNESTTSASRITEARDFDQLLAIQYSFANRQAERVMDYWAGLYQAVSESQVDLLRRAQSQAADLQGKWREAAISYAPQVTERLLTPLQSVVEAVSSSYAASVRTAEQATRAAADQAVTATAEVRSNEERANEVLANAARANEGARKRA